MSGLVNKLITDGTQQELGTVPGEGNAYAMVNIVVSNPLQEEASLTLWMSVADEPTLVDIIEPAATVPANGYYEMVGRVASAGERIFIQAPAGMVARLESIEEQ